MAIVSWRANNMKLLYATSITLPSYRANRLQIVSMARAWMKLLKNDFILGVGSVTDASLDGINHVVMGAQARSFTLAWRYLMYAKKGAYTHLYCREEKLLLFMIVYNRFFFRLPLTFCYEIHYLAYTRVWWYAFLLRNVGRVVSITKAMKDILVKAGYPEGNILVAPDAVDFSLFGTTLDKSGAREKLALPPETKIVVYTGDLDEPWKGVGTLYEAAKTLGEQYLFLIVGSKPHHIEYFRADHPDLSNFKLLGYKPHSEIPLYLTSADIAVLPNSGKSEISRISTSPMKLFEYMAAGVPIVASDLPSIREILDETSALLVTPDNAQALAEGIRTLVGDRVLAQKLAAKARREVSSNTWERRARLILDFLRHEP